MDGTPPRDDVVETHNQDNIVDNTTVPPGPENVDNAMTAEHQPDFTTLL